MNTIIEKIRAEVERLKQEIYPVKVGEQRVNRGPTSMESAALGALNTLMSRISTLQEKSEKPINQDDIDTEIGHWMSCLDDKYCMLVNHYSIQDIKDTAHHFYELGRQSKPKVCEGLEEAAKKCSLNLQLQDYFKKGASWQNEQMMKEAVEGVICGDNAKLWVCNNPPSFILDKFKDGDKVKLIFIKED